MRHPADTAGSRTCAWALASTVGRVTKRPVGPVLALLVAGALGCSTVSPSAPTASATPSSDHPAPTISDATPGGGATSPVGAAGERGPRGRPSVPAAPELAGAYRFVSAPDFLNQDVADLTADGKRLLKGRVGGLRTTMTARGVDAVGRVQTVRRQVVLRAAR